MDEKSVIGLRFRFIHRYLSDQKSIVKKSPIYQTIFVKLLKKGHFYLFIYQVLIFYVFI